MTMKKNVYISFMLGFLVVQLFLDACGSDSDDGASTSVASNGNFTYNTFEGLNAESPCNEFLEDAVAYVKNERKNYICNLDTNSLQWKWNSSQNSSTQYQIDNGNQVFPNDDASNGKDIIPSTESNGIVEVFSTYDNLLAGRPCDENTSGYAYVSSLNQYYICTFNDEMVVDVNNFEEYKWFSFEEYGQIASDNGLHNNCPYIIKKIEAIQTYVVYNDGRSSSNSGNVAQCVSTSYNPDYQFCDMRDGQIYRYVAIAPKNSDYNQVWMAENLNYPVQGSYCGEGGTLDSCSKFGRYYTYETAIGNARGVIIQGVCPLGWHIPNNEEWTNLKDAIELELKQYNQNNEVYLWDGDLLRSRTEWNEYGGSDSYGFSALPAGYGFGGRILSKGQNANFWSTSKQVFRISSSAYLGDSYLNDAMSIRCVRDY